MHACLVKIRIWCCLIVLVRHGATNATIPLGAVLAVDGAQGVVEMPTAEEIARFEDDSKL